MKKLLFLTMCVAVMLFLSGCSAKEAISSDKQEYLVASLGFDQKGQKLTMYMEAIVVNTDDMQAEKQNLLLSGEGANINEAYEQIISKTTQPLSLGHNGVTVVGRSITPQMLDEILLFCSENKELNIATMLLSCENAEKLLSCKPLSSVAVGYDLMSMVEVTEEERGTIFENRLYQVRSQLEKPLKLFSVPFIQVEDGKFSLEGNSVFKENSLVSTLNIDRSQLFFLLKDRVSKGELIVGGEKLRVDFSKVTYDFQLKNNLIITVNLRIKSSDDMSALNNAVKRFLTEQKDDIFGFGNIISQKKPKIWAEIKKNYPDYFKNAEIKVNFNE